MPVLRYGISGCGSHAVNAHLLPTQELTGLLLAGVYDVRPEAVASVRERFGASIVPFRSEEALFGSDVDAVLISTPDHLHARSLLKAIIESSKFFVLLKDQILMNISKVGG